MFKYINLDYSLQGPNMSHTRISFGKIKLILINSSLFRLTLKIPLPSKQASSGTFFSYCALVRLREYQMHATHVQAHQVTIPTLVFQMNEYFRLPNKGAANLSVFKEKFPANRIFIVQISSLTLHWSEFFHNGNAYTALLR